ncbi:MAG TPA: IPT/TIG domain-containing protein [Terriglobia bacterium]|nr:IPT/TIG domain-containing protein [Terriglobia bacterium]
MMRGEFFFAKIWRASRLALGTVLICFAVPFCMLAAQQPDSDIPPDATPQIQQINPSQGVPGAHLTVIIQGSNFSGGAAASSASAAIHVDSSKRVSATQLEVQLSISASAQPGTVSLSVSNPASQAAEMTFTIVAAEAAPAPAPEAPPQSPEPPKPAPPAPPQTPPEPAVPATAPPPTPPAGEANPTPPATPPAPVAPPAPAAPASPATPPAPAAPSEPEVTTIIPPRVAQGFDVDLKITGSNFAQGAKVTFANQGVRTLGITSSSSNELIVHIKVATDAPTGKTSLFVINPDENEAEVPFEVTKKGTLAPSAPPSPGSPPTADPNYTQRFDAFHLGNPTEIFHVHGKVKGSLVISSGTLKYVEDGKTLVNVSLSEIEEAKTAGIGGFNIKLKSGKTIHFAAASLKGSDARTIVDAIQKAIPPATASAN